MTKRVMQLRTSEIAEMPTMPLAPGGMFLLGLMADIAVRYTSLPQVTLSKVLGL